MVRLGLQRRPKRYILDPQQRLLRRFPKQDSVYHDRHPRCALPDRRQQSLDRLGYFLGQGRRPVRAASSECCARLDMGTTGMRQPPRHVELFLPSCLATHSCEKPQQRACGRNLCLGYGAALGADGSSFRLILSLHSLSPCCMAFYLRASQIVLHGKIVYDISVFLFCFFYVRLEMKKTFRQLQVASQIATTSTPTTKSLLTKCQLPINKLLPFV